MYDYVLGLTSMNIIVYVAKREPKLISNRGYARVRSIYHLKAAKEHDQ